MKTFTLKVLLASGFGLLSALSASAQMKVGANPTSIDPSAVLQVDAIPGGTKQGFLLPRVALTSTTAFTPLASHVAGMTVYNTATTGDVTPGYYYNDGLKWVKAAASSVEPWFSTATNTGSVSNTEKIYYKGKVAVGDGTDPDASLFYGPSNTTFGLQKTVTDLSGYINGNINELAIKPGAAASNLSVRGLHSLLHIQGANNITGGDIYGIAANFVHEGSGTIDNFKTAGINLDYAVAGGGRIKNGFGVSINMGVGSGQIDNAYGLQVGASGTNAYGVYVSPTTSTSLGYGVYQEGAKDKNYFAGHTAIGGFSTNPNYLQFYGSPTAGSTLLAVQDKAGDAELAGGSTQAGAFTMLLNPTANVSGNYYRNIHSLVQTSPSSTANYSGGDLAGIISGMEHLGSGAINQDVRGFDNFINNRGPGSMRTVLGTFTNIDNRSTGSIGDAFAFRAGINNGGAGTINNAYGFFAATGGGNVTNSYGLYIYDLAGTNRWGVYQKGVNDKNYFAGRVGVGDGNTDPNATLFYGPSNSTFGVQKTITDPTGYINGNITELAINPSAAASNLGVRGLHSLLHIQGANNITGGDIYGIAANFVHEGSGTIDNFKTAGINLDYGISGGGRIKRAFGITINMGVGNGVIDDAYGVQVSTSGTNAYGVYISPTAFTSLGYGVYQEGTKDNNYFAGNVGIGTTTPTSKLQVVGLPSYASDAAAGAAGLTAGAFYQSSVNVGVVMVKQ